MSTTLDQIHSLAIFPPLGIARVGNSDEYYFAPEIPGQPGNPEGGFKDRQGRIKKQVTRFRIYALDQHGKPIMEITAKTATIAWRVHVANRKAAWYQFKNALDIPGLAIPSTFRNADISGEQRQQLIIDPGPHSICGVSKSGPAYHLTGGKFFEKEVPLGEIRTDEEGRLLFFGGDGQSTSRTGAAAITFANNDGWHDDVADGPIRASVTIDGRVFEAEPAFVVVTPPNFGQGLYGVVTMYDVVRDLYTRIAWLPVVERPNFWQHIYPILERMSQMQWVNSGFFMLFGHNSPSDFTHPDLLVQLASPAQEHAALRQRYAAWMRDPANTAASPNDFPPTYGDAFGDYEDIYNENLPFTATQYAWLQAWAEGNFEASPLAPSLTFDELSAQQQTEALCEAPLEECLGGPFHPGIEITWPLRQAITWDKPFRLKILPEGVAPCEDFGPLLAPQIALAKGGPLDGNGPGSMTRWLGLPWQTDNANCLSGYCPSAYLPLPSFWSARVPNQVMSMDSYQRLQDTQLNLGQRLKHFDFRQAWLRDFSNINQIRINDMIREWHELGIIAAHPPIDDNAGGLLPAKYWVESGRGAYQTDSSLVQLIRAETGSEPAPPKALQIGEKPLRKRRRFARTER